MHRISYLKSILTFLVSLNSGVFIFADHPKPFLHHQSSLDQFRWNISVLTDILIKIVLIRRYFPEVHASTILLTSTEAPVVTIICINLASYPGSLVGWGGEEDAESLVSAE